MDRKWGTGVGDRVAGRSRTWQLLLGFGLTLGAGGCDEEKELEEDVSASAGLSQLGDAEPPYLDEDEACELIEAALTGRQDALDCDAVGIAACPGLIRPAGSLACLQYSESSVEACVEQIDEFSRCSDFNFKACYAIAILGETTPGCVAPSDLDASSVVEEDAGLSESEGAVDAGSADSGSDAATMPGETTPGDGGTTAPDGSTSDAAVDDAG